MGGLRARLLPGRTGLRRGECARNRRWAATAEPPNDGPEHRRDDQRAGQVGLGEREGEPGVVGDDNGAAGACGLPDEGDDLLGVVVHAGLGEAVAADDMGDADGAPDSKEEKNGVLHARAQRADDKRGGGGEDRDEQQAVARLAAEAGDGDEQEKQKSAEQERSEGAAGWVTQ